MDHTNNKIKVIFSSYDNIHNPYYAGGGAIAIHEVAKRLTNYFDIAVITGNYPGAKDKEVDKVFYKHIGPKQFGPQLGQLLYQFTLPIALSRYPFDIWIESFTPPFSTAFLPLFTRKPVIGLVHMLASPDMERKYKVPFHIIENIGLKTYPTMIVTSDIFKQKISHITPTSQITTIPNGINMPNQPIAKTSKPYILYLGRIEYDQKGLDLLIDAFASIQSQTDIHLIIAGSGHAQDLQRLEERIKSYHLNNRITLTGKVMGEQKDTLLQECTLVVIPSRFETFSMVALESIAYGKPIVAFNIDGLSWVPQTVAQKVKPFNSSEFGQKVLSILKNTSIQQEVAKNSKNFIQNYTWEEIVNRYQMVINQTLHLI